MRYLNAETKEPLGDTVITIDIGKHLSYIKFAGADSLIVEDTRPDSHYKFTVYHHSYGGCSIVGTQFETFKQAQDWNLSRKI